MKKNKIDEVTNDFIKIVRNRLKNNLKKVIMFGSRARGDFAEGADYDFLVVVDKRGKGVLDAILDACVEIMDRYYALIGCIVCDEKEWERKKRFPIGLNILKEGIEL
jgi:predicted nucleotidyltransferase